MLKVTSRGSALLRALALIALFALEPAWGLGAEPLSLSAGGTLNLPLGDYSTFLGPGFGAALDGRLDLLQGVPLGAEAGLSYLGHGITGSRGYTFSLLTFRLGLDWRIPLGETFGIEPNLGGGPELQMLNDGSAPALGLGLDLGTRFTMQFGDLRSFLDARFSYSSGIPGVAFGGGLAFDLPAGSTAPGKVPPASSKPKPLPAPQNQTQPPKAKPLVLKTGANGLQVLAYSLDPVFPVFYRYYDQNSLGYLTIKNSGGTAIQNLNASFLVKQFMDDPKDCPGPALLKPGEEIRIPLYALFSDSILGVTEGNTVSAGVSIGYTVNGKTQNLSLTGSLKLYDRNALTWSDDRKAAAFVTSKDPLVLRFSKNLAAFLDESRRFGNPKGFVAALGLFESLRHFGLRYSVDPAASYAAASQKDDAVDFIQFPRQTLDFKAGDCDDLSVLNAALLEAIGVRSAFVTTPGHIFVAVDLELAPEEARKRFSADSLIILGERSWLPFEVTALNGEFLQAWELGAREWREAAAKGLAALHPVAEAWADFPPVGFSGETAQAQPPEAASLSTDCLKELERYAEQSVAAPASKVLAEIQKSGRTSSLLNRLGVLYAAAGLRDKARPLFKEAAAKDEYLSALLNLGNLAFLDRDFQTSLSFYDRALKKSPKNPKALLGLARANHELENYGQARSFYASLQSLDPELAARFAYLELRGEESLRAADQAGLKESVVWSE